jgi:rhodanese-related sulfurtransferase
MGFKNVVSLAGGFDAWSAEGRKILKPSVEAIE